MQIKSAVVVFWTYCTIINWYGLIETADSRFVNEEEFRFGILSQPTFPGGELWRCSSHGHHGLASMDPWLNRLLRKYSEQWKGNLTCVKIKRPKRLEGRMGKIKQPPVYTTVMIVRMVSIELKNEMPSNLNSLKCCCLLDIWKKIWTLRAEWIEIQSFSLGQWGGQIISVKLSKKKWLRSQVNVTESICPAPIANGGPHSVPPKLAMMSS